MTRTTRRSLIRSALAVPLLPARWLASAATRKAALREPGKIPSRIVLTLSGDPARTEAVTWRTDTLVSAPQAQIAPVTGRPEVVESARTIAAKGQLVTPSADTDKKAAHYSVRFQDLEPATRYNYRVGDGANWSEWNTFQTASTRPEPFRFLYVGDAQNDIRSLWSRTIRTAYAAVPDARFIVHAGDLVADGFDDNLWAEWCDAMGFIGGTVPSLPVPGNHDLHRAPGSPEPENPLRAADPFGWHFALPMNGPEGLQGQSYCVDYQGVRLISLDVNVFTGKVGAADSFKAKLAARQLAWLEKLLQQNPNRWTVVFQHQPVYPIARDREPSNVSTLLLPVYDKYPVDLVLAGHDHAYGRTHKLRGGKVVPADQPGTVYAVSVSGPKMYALTVAKPELMAKTLAGTQLFQVIGIDGDQLHFEARSVDGGTIDSFDLRKTGSRP
jgi:3',5'-cyclic AMP phosphodiesterase CpdA